MARRFGRHSLVLAVALDLAPPLAAQAPAAASAELKPAEKPYRTAFHAFAGFKGTRSRYGVAYARQRWGAAQGPDRIVSVASIFGIWGVGKTLSVLSRIDRSFDGIPDAGDIPYLGLAQDTEFDFVLLGLDYGIHRMISVIPNVEYVAYCETDGRPDPDDDLIARLTLSVLF